MKVLFICNQNQNRSKTAEKFFEGEFEAKSAGLYNESPVTQTQLAWADIVVVMEEKHRSEIAKRFPEEYLKKQIISLDIANIYQFNQPELIVELEKKMHLLS